MTIANNLLNQIKGGMVSNPSVRDQMMDLSNQYASLGQPNTAGDFLTGMAKGYANAPQDASFFNTLTHAITGGTDAMKAGQQTGMENIAQSMKFKMLAENTERALEEFEFKKQAHKQQMALNQEQNALQKYHFDTERMKTEGELEAKQNKNFMTDAQKEVAISDYKNAVAELSMLDKLIEEEGNELKHLVKTGSNYPLLGEPKGKGGAEMHQAKQKDRPEKYKTPFGKDLNTNKAIVQNSLVHMSEKKLWYTLFIHGKQNGWSDEKIAQTYEIERKQIIPQLKARFKEGFHGYSTSP